MQRKIKTKIQKIEQLRGKDVNKEVHDYFMEEVNTLLQRY